MMGDGHHFFYIIGYEWNIPFIDQNHYPSFRIITTVVPLL
jgi:hypothetical protein